MTTTTKLALASGVGVLLGALSLEPVFVTLAWLRPVLITVLAIVAVSIAARRVRPLGAWAPLLELGAGLLVLTALFAPTHAFLGFLPTWTSLSDMRELLGQAGYAVRTQVSPAQTLTELLFLAALGVGAVAVAVDIVAVSMRRPAVAGLALLMLYAIPTAAIVEGIPWWPFAGAATGYLIMLFVDGRESLLRWGRPADGQSTPRFGLPASRRIGLLAILAGVAVPLLVPTLPPGILNPAGNGIGNGPGVSLNPLVGLAGELTLPEPVDLLRVRVNVDDPYYLRSVSLETYTDQGWAPGNLDGTFDANAGSLPGVPGTSPTRRLDAQITVLNQDDRFLSTYYSTRDIDSPGDWRFDAISSTVWSKTDRTAGLTYRVVADEPRPTQSQLVAAPDLSSNDQVQRRFTALAQGVRPEIADLVRRLVSGANGPFARTLAISNFFTNRDNGFVYSLSTKPGTSGSDLVDFLTNRRGYCEQYAAAMAVMLRFANVPARVVIGYTPGKRDGDTWTVTTDDAHAWVEAYFDKIGWVPFDPTPLAGGRGITLPYAPRADSLPSGSSASSTNTVASGSGQQPTARLEPQLAPNQGPGSSGGGAAGLLDPRTTLISLGVALVVVALLSPLAVRLLRRRRRLSLAAAGGLAGAHAAWDEMLAVATDLRGRLIGSETPRGVARRLAREYGFDRPAAEAVRLLATAEERARYAPAAQAVVDGDLAAAARTAGRAMRRESRRQDRVRAVLAPPSSVLSMRAALAGMGQRGRQRMRGLVPTPRTP